MKISKRTYLKANKIVEQYRHQPVPMTGDNGEIVMLRQRCRRCFRIVCFADKEMKNQCPCKPPKNWEFLKEYNLA